MIILGVLRETFMKKILNIFQSKFFTDNHFIKYLCLYLNFRKLISGAALFNGCFYCLLLYCYNLTDILMKKSTLFTPLLLLRRILLVHRFLILLCILPPPHILFLLHHTLLLLRHILIRHRILLHRIPLHHNTLVHLLHHMMILHHPYKNNNCQ